MMKISIITVCFNSVLTIADTIKSVQSQSYSDTEHIIIDGGSTDGTVRKVEDLVGPSVKFLSEPDKGIYDAMNKGLRMATGDIVGTLNADDVFYDGGVVGDIASFFFDPEVDCIYGNLVYVDRNNSENITRRWTSQDFKDGLFQKSWTPAHPTFYCRKKFFDKFGLYSLEYEIAADVELMYRFLEKHKIKSRYVDRYMVKMRDSGISNRGIISTITITREMRKAIIENNGRFNLLKYLLFKALKVKQIISR